MFGKEKITLNCPCEDLIDLINVGFIAVLLYLLASDLKKKENSLKVCKNTII